jgi:hypothetical protein
MKVTSTLMTIAEYCAQIENNAITINRDYQRSPKRWPPAARSFLIDTILHGYPVPKVIIAQQTDLKTRRTVKEVVDGQQRTMAIYDFFRSEFRITGDSPFAGMTFSDLEAEQQQAFLDYPLGVDVFTGVDQNGIRETFRRMNSYTVPLNPQERRYATHQGKFKWFIFEQSGVYAEMFKNLGVFNEKQISAMQDGLLLTELSVALVLGIKTASNPILDKFYRDRDESLPEQKMLTQSLRRAFDFILKMPDLHGTTLMKPYQFYSLSLAAAHATRPVPALSPLFEFPAGFSPDPNLAASKLGSLVLALDGEEQLDALKDFIQASSKATNTEGNRTTRFRYCCMAIGETLPE